MTNPTGPVLIAYDGSEASAEAIARAAPLLATRRAQVVRVWDSLAGLLLHTDIQGLTGTMREAAEEVDSEDANNAAAIAAEGAELARKAGFEADACALRERPNIWPALLEHADKLDAQVIVVGSRGLGGVKSALYGSVSSGLLHHSHRPLLVVPPCEGPAGSGPVIVGFDGSDAARVAVGGEPAGCWRTEPCWCTRPGASTPPVAAGGLAGAPVAVVTRAAAEIDKELEARAARTAQEGAELATAVGLDAEAEPVEANEAEWWTLIRSARERQAAGIVVGSRGRSAAGAALLGSVSSGLVHHSGVPVLVVPPPRT